MYYRPAHRKNYVPGNRTPEDVIFIVVHYDAGKKATARNNVDAFTHLLTGTSAHYFVDENEVAMSVLPRHKAQHCGGERYNNGAPAPFHGKCTNSNSIGVELCSDFVNGKYYITKATEDRGAEFVADLMKEWGVPLSRVVRHYDVTGKHCPMPYVEEKAWDTFKAKVWAAYNREAIEKEVETIMTYEKVTDIPAGEMRETVQNLVDMGIIKGSGKGLGLTHDMVRVIVFMERRFQYHNEKQL